MDYSGGGLAGEFGLVGGVRLLLPPYPIPSFGPLPALHLILLFLSAPKRIPLLRGVNKHACRRITRRRSESSRILRQQVQIRVNHTIDRLGIKLRVPRRHGVFSRGRGLFDAGDVELEAVYFGGD